VAVRAGPRNIASALPRESLIEVALIDEGSIDEGSIDECVRGDVAVSRSGTTVDEVVQIGPDDLLTAWRT
jgi:hypothetical protein